jgi:hypothetical protein
MDAIHRGKWEEMKRHQVEKEGWFVPTLHIKFAQPSRDRLLKDLCSKWLLENFNMNADIRELLVMKREKIDEILGLFCIKFTFSCKDGRIGESVAFIEAGEMEDAP